MACCGCGTDCCNRFACCSFPHKKWRVVLAITFCVLATLTLFLGGGFSIMIVGLVPTLLFCLTACTQVNKCGLITAGVFSLLCAASCAVFAVGIYNMIDTCNEAYDDLYKGNMEAEDDVTATPDIYNNMTDYMNNSTTTTTTEVGDDDDNHSPFSNTCNTTFYALVIIWAISGVFWLAAGLMAFFMPLSDSVTYFLYDPVGEAQEVGTSNTKNNNNNNNMMV